MEPIETTATEVAPDAPQPPQSLQQLQQLDPNEVLQVLRETHPEALSIATQRVYIQKLEAALAAK
jgi:hypothetical protein